VVTRPLFGLGLGLTVIGYGLASVSSVSYVLVSWSQIDHLFLKCNNFWLCSATSEFC